jgi:glycerophosphoryl diester phosphodiesterase
MAKRLNSRFFDLQGHRGARGLAPENTLPAFAKAMEIGVSTLELDTAVTRDGVVVVAHDRRLNPDITRDKYGKWLLAPTATVRSLDFAELRELDVGRIDPQSGYYRRFAGQLGMDGVAMPALTEVFELVKRSGNSQLRFNIETKLSPLFPGEAPQPEEFVNALLACIAAANLMDRVTVQSFDWRVLRLVRGCAPQVTVSYLTTQHPPDATVWTDVASPWTDGISYAMHGSVPRMIAAAAAAAPIASPAGFIWSPHFADIDEGAVTAAHALNIAVLPWTLNDPEEIARAILMGVDGLISDYPDRARTVMARMGIELPSSSPGPMA